MEKAYLTLHGVTKTFGPVKALDQVSFSAGKGEFLSILGPSGCGKTTALRVIAGLEHQSDGQVLINGRDVTGMPVSKRNVGIVFQSYALFPNLNAEKNIAYGLRG
ncbi:ATP-binding cassette domain-containing protein, partial [Desulfobacter sp.]|uniref:ATP-binding cassette domain-containing protein n=1 Tax=Desulfobacter sp. TaxID=2294 RepID=UPI003D0DA393